MRKTWLMQLCACALALCLAVGGAWAEEEGRSLLIGQYTSGQTLEASFSAAGNVLAAKSESGSFLLNAQGEKPVPAGTNDAISIADDMEGLPLFAVTRGEGRGVIDAQGRELVPPVYDAVRCYSEKWQAGVRAEAVTDGDYDYIAGGVCYQIGRAHV